MYSCDDAIMVTSFSRYFLKRSNLASEITEVAFILIAFGSSRTTPLFLSFLLRAWNLLSLDRNDSTTLFSLNNLLTLLQPPFWIWNSVAGLFLNDHRDVLSHVYVNKMLLCVCLSQRKVRVSNVNWNCVSQDYSDKPINKVVIQLWRHVLKQ